jgi:tetratricopeptide (TPR) repeat protein
MFCARLGAAEAPDADLYYKSATAAFQIENYDVALQNVSKAIELNPEFIEALSFRGFIECTVFGSNNAAIIDCTRAIELDSKSQLAYYVRGVAKSHLMDFKGAIADFDMVNEFNPNSSEVHRERGIARFHLKEYRDAVEDFDIAIELGPKKQNAWDVEVYGFRGTAKRHIFDCAGAVADLSKAIELNTNAPASYVERGLAKDGLKEYASAIADFNQAIQLNRNDAYAYLSRGTTQIYLKCYDAAMEDFNKAIELNPRYASAYAGIGYIQSNRLQLKSALSSFYKSLELDSNLDYSRFCVWLLRVQLGEGEDANKELVKYLNSVQGEEANSWQMMIGKFLAGSITQDSLLDFAINSAEILAKRNEQLCEAYYYVGMKHLLANDKSEASAFFYKCLATGKSNCFEYVSAEARLDQLDSTRQP